MKRVEDLTLQVLINTSWTNDENTYTPVYENDYNEPKGAPGRS